MHPEVQSYIDRINANDATLTEISLPNLFLGNAGIEPLMEALANNQIAAQRILSLNLSRNELTAIRIPATLTVLNYLGLNDNELTAINIPATLRALRRVRLSNNQLTAINVPATLEELILLALNGNQLSAIIIPATLRRSIDQLFLSDNPLTDATKFSLQAEWEGRITLSNLQYDSLPNDAALTLETLDAHLATILQPAIGYFKNLLKTIGATQLVRMPTDLLTILNDMLPRPEIVSAQASMTYFRDIFGRSALQDKLNTLNKYNIASIMPFIDPVESEYRRLFDNLKTVIRARGAINRDNVAVLNQPHRSNPVLFSSMPPAAEEPKNETYCAFKPGFLLNRKNGLFN